MLLNYPQISPTNAIYASCAGENRGTKNLTDYWALRYDKEKENELVYFLKRQNLSQIKNLIDKTLYLREKGKFPNHDRYVKKEEAKELLQKEYLTQRDKKIKEKEVQEKEFDEYITRKKKEDFNKEIIEKRREEEMLDKKLRERQENLFERRKEWASNNFKHMTKVENIYQKKHDLAVNEYDCILKKGKERFEKIEDRKYQFNLKSNEENKRRYMQLVHYKIKTKEEVNQMRRRLEEKHKNISLFYSMQLEKRKNIIDNQKKVRDEKVLSNIYKRVMNKNKEFERKIRLLDLFERNEERVEQKILLKEKKNEEFKYNNLLRSDEMSNNYLRNMQQLNNRNQVKLQRMRTKEDEVNNKILSRQNSAQVRIKRYDDIKVNKDLMLEHAKQILEEIKDYKPEEVYRQVFTRDDMNMLNE
jgi:hypothetical protein